MRIRIAIILILAGVCGACHSIPLSNTSSGAAGGGNGTNPKSFIQGEATVLEVHNELGFALLDIRGKRVYGYWQSDPTTLQNGSLDNNGPWGATVGEVHESVVHHQDLLAKPGDTIAFRGFQTGPDIFLSGVQVLSR